MFHTRGGRGVPFTSSQYQAQKMVVNVVILVLPWFLYFVFCYWCFCKVVLLQCSTKLKLWPKGRPQIFSNLKLAISILSSLLSLLLSIIIEAICCHFLNASSHYSYWPTLNSISWNLAAQTFPIKVEHTYIFIYVICTNIY